MRCRDESRAVRVACDVHVNVALLASRSLEQLEANCRDEGPAGVGAGRKPPQFLAASQVLETWIEGVGTIRNRCV